MDNAVALVQAYLRLNGFFTVTEFQVQQPVPGRPEVYETATDLDILAIRLPWAAETVPRRGPKPGATRAEVILSEDPLLGIAASGIDLIIGEVKEGVGELNRKLRTPEVLHSAVRRAGCCPEEHFETVITQLATSGEARIASAEGIPCRLRLASFCGVVGSEAAGPVLLTVTLGHIIAFVQDRLRTYAPILRSVAFRDPVLDLMKLMWKLGIELRIPQG